MKQKHDIKTETLMKVGIDCNRDFGCLGEECSKRVDGVVVCDEPEFKSCIFRFGTSLPNPMCMCWVKIEK